MAGTPVAGDMYFDLDGKMLEIKRQLRQRDGYPFDLLALKRALQEIVEGRFQENSAGVAIDWYQVYEKFGMQVELGKFLNERPERQAACSNQRFWSVPVLKGLTPNTMVETLRSLGVTVGIAWGEEAFDSKVSRNDRDPSGGSYLISFRRTSEADFENVSKSAVVQGGGITLLERLVLEVGYFLETGRHLDIYTRTLCSGSRFTDGTVPTVGFHLSFGLQPQVRTVCVDRSSSDNYGPALRSRTPFCCYH